MPRFLERDEAEREPPCEPYPWDGVRNVRPFSRLGSLRGRGRVLRPPVGSTSLSFAAVFRTPACDVATAVPHHRTRQPFVEVSQANSGLIRRDLLPDRQAATRAAARRAPGRASCCDMCPGSGRPFPRAATLPRSVRIGSRRRITSSRSPPRRACRSRSSAATWTRLPRRSSRDAARARRPHARAGPRRARRERIERPPELSFYPARAGPGRRSAQQLARGARAVDSRHRAEDAARLEARQRRTLDSLPHCAGVHGRGVPARGLQRTTPATTRGQAKSSGAADAACSSATCRLSGRSRATRASSCTAPATARCCSDRTASTRGASTST